MQRSTTLSTPTSHPRSKSRDEFADLYWEEELTANHARKNERPQTLSAYIESVFSSQGF